MGRASSPPRRDWPVIQVVGGKTVVRPHVPAGGRAAGARHRAGRRRVRHRDRRRRAGGAGRRRVRRVGGAAHDRRRARGAGRAGGHVVSDRELPRVPVGRVGRRAGERALEQARRLGAEILVTRSITRIDTAHASGVSRRGRRPARPDDHPRVRRDVAAAVDRRLRPVGREGHLLRRRAQRGEEHARSRRPHRRYGQLGRAGRRVVLDPCAERDDPLPRRRAGEEHVALPHRPGRGAAERPRAGPGRRSSPRTATSPSRRSTSATRRRARSRGSSPAGCTSSSARMPRRRGCRPRSRSTPTATCSRARTCAPRDAGRSNATRTSSRRACRASSRAATSGSPR